MVTRGGQQRPTQRQIANEVGVSPTTVSRVLNPYESNPGRWASAYTINQIRQAATQMGYINTSLSQPSLSARSRSIALMFPTADDYVVSAIQSGIDQVAADNQMTSIMACTMEGIWSRSARTSAMLDCMVAGLIFADARLDEQLLASVQAKQVPFTLVHRRHPDFVSVHADDRAAGRLAAEHLIGLGRTRLAFIGGRSRVSTGKDRIDGFTSVIRQAGLPQPRIIETDHYVESGQAATRELLADRQIPDAIFAAHDWAAIGGLSVLRKHGLKVPEDVAVVGCYDTPLAQATDLTSIRIDLEQMGRQACQLLLNQIHNQPAQSETLPVTISVRGTTNPVPRF